MHREITVAHAAQQRPKRIVGERFARSLPEENQLGAAMIAVCHCKNCQRQSGTAFGTVVGVPKGTLNVNGTLRTYEDLSETGNAMHRRFRPECGSRVTTDADGIPNLTFIMAGTLDDTSWVDPTVQFWCASAQPWVSLPEKVKPFQRMSG